MSLDSGPRDEKLATVCAFASTAATARPIHGAIEYAVRPATDSTRRLSSGADATGGMAWGGKAARGVGEVVSVQVISRPHDDLAAYVDKTTGRASTVAAGAAKEKKR